MAVSVREAEQKASSRHPWWWSLVPGLRQGVRHGEDPAELEQRFILQVVQPALVGLMDGSVSTLAPIFASAYATGRPHVAFVVGLAAAVGAAISMGFAEALSDTGELTGRGGPVQRGVITGVATFIGGVLHTLPFLIPVLHLALVSAYIVVGVELIAIALIRYRFFKMPMLKSVIQVIVGGALVFAAGVLIGNS